MTSWLAGLPGFLTALVVAGGPLPLLLAGSLLIPLAWLFLARRSKSKTESEVPSPRDRFWLRVVGGAALGEVSVYVASALLAFGATGSILPLLVPFLLPAPLLLGTALGAFCGAASSRRHWRAEGVLAYLGLGFLAVGFVEYALQLLRTTPMGPAWGLALFLLATELFGFLVMLLYQFYALEFLAGIRRRPLPQPAPLEAHALPCVATQVACFNEPLELVQRCLESVRALDYPGDRLWVQLLDDSTDPTSRAQLERLCRRLGVDYLHRSNRGGFKAGALNAGTNGLPPEVELLAIVDADYRVDPQFLRRTVGYFRDPEIAWVQTPQSYWNAEESVFTHLYGLADAYFYRVIQPVRHDAGSSIFCGTMGVLRRRALAQVGGWDEACITEDAEVSLRLYAVGWKSLYVPMILGAGLAPDRFPALRSQFSRWAFGGLQLLRRDLVPLFSRRLSFRQRLDFLASGIFWMDGAFLLAMAGGLTTLALGALTGLAWAMPSPPLLVGISLAPVLLVLDGLVKTRLALGRVLRLRLRDAAGVMAFWYALKMTNLRASVRALFGRPMAFTRTPKTPAPVERAGGFGVLRPTVFELALAVGTAVAAVVAATVAPLGSVWAGLGRSILVGWLGYYAVTFGAAPLFSLVGRRRRPSSSSGIQTAADSPPD